MRSRTSKSRTWRLLLILGLTVAVGGLIFGYFLWNKPHTKVEQTQALELAPQELAQAYAEDEEEANQRFLGKTIRLRAEIQDFLEDEQGKSVLVLEIPNHDRTISATLRDPATGLERGARVQITGFCSGVTMFDILLSECIINDYEGPAH